MLPVAEIPLDRNRDRLDLENLLLQPLGQPAGLFDYGLREPLGNTPRYRRDDLIRRLLVERGIDPDDVGLALALGLGRRLAVVVVGIVDVGWQAMSILVTRQVLFGLVMVFFSPDLAEMSPGGS